MSAKALLSLRSLFAVALIAAAGCDPVDIITLHVPASPGAAVMLHWVRKSGEHVYVDGPAFRGHTSGPEVVAREHACCGIAAEYRARELWFLACEDRAGAAPLLTCGKAGAPPASFVRSAASAPTCQALEPSLSSGADIDVDTCRVRATVAP